MLGEGHGRRPDPILGLALDSYLNVVVLDGR